MNLNRYMDPSYNAAVAAAWGSRIAQSVSSQEQHFSFEGRRTQHRKIVVGYLSSDFYDHPIAQVINGLFELHNRDQFEINCYSSGTDDGSLYRKKIEAGCDRFVDIRAMKDKEAAQCIHADKVDILVDLNGYTKDARLEICGYRPAPIQVNYLGFPGTCGTDFHDYIVADPIVAPLEHAAFFSEKIVHLPHCYLVTDNHQPISEKKYKRDEFALPAEGFVFCSFNNALKIEQVMFSAWMRIIKKVPDSVLWLPSPDKTTIRNICREAEQNGVSSQRLIFANRVPTKAEHLSRLQLADLALDTRIWNGHATSIDCLWSGLPVLTLTGNHFASRVATSIVQAVGLPELIAADLEEFEKKAVALATSSGQLASIRQKLAVNRLHEPLFDTPRFTANLEKAFTDMWEIYAAGEEKRHIRIE